MRRVFQLEYLRIHDEWSRNVIHDGQVEDTGKILILVEIADAHIQEVASRYRLRLILHALRSVPLRILCLLSGMFSIEAVVAMVIAATNGLRRHARETMHTEVSTKNGLSVLEITTEEDFELRENIGFDLARILGAAFARQAGEAAYRLAGKGGRLVRPKPTAEADWAALEQSTLNGILLLPTPEVDASVAVLKAVEQYEKRQKTESVPAGSGVLLRKPGLMQSGDFNWWALMTPSSHEHIAEMAIAYPAINRTFVSASYWLQPTNADHILYLLQGFAEPFQHRTGFSHVDFIACCRALFDLVGVQTGYWQLYAEPPTGKHWRFLSTLQADEKVVSGAAVHLYGILSRGYLRAPRRAFVNGIADWLKQNGHTSAHKSAELFVTRFTDSAEPIGPFEPILFYRVDPELLVLDCFMMAHFLEACLRITTAGDGAVGNLRASAFELQAREAIISGLGLSKSEIPFPPGRDLIFDGTNFGDVDFAFVRNNLLINLDMKAWQMNEKYFRGDFLAIDNRQKTLVKYLEGSVAPRGERLLSLVRQESGLELHGVLSLLCVPSVEYISPQYPELWSGSTPRVLTPFEIVSLFEKTTTTSQN